MPVYKSGVLPLNDKGISAARRNRTSMSDVPSRHINHCYDGSKKSPGPVPLFEHQ
jgi:hypothetical protein